MRAFFFFVVLQSSFYEYTSIIYEIITKIQCFKLNLVVFSVKMKKITMLYTEYVSIPRDIKK